MRTRKFGSATAVILLATALSQAATTRYVDPAGTCGGNTPCTTTIQAAITAASNGDTIVVGAGTYNENLNVNKSVTLQGANAGVHPAVGKHPTETVGVRGPETILANNYYALSPAANNITVDGFKFTGHAGRLIDTYSNADNFHLTNCIFNDPVAGSSTGVVQFGGGSHTDMLIDFNVFQDQGDSTLYFGGGPYDRLHIAYNKFNGYGNGVFWAATPLVDGVIQANEFDGTIAGVPGDGGVGLNIGQGGNLSIIDNWFHDMYYTAFQVGIIGGSITGNTFERTYSSGNPWADAFELWGGQYGTAVSTNVNIQCNRIRYNDIPAATAPSHGVRLRTFDSPPGIDGSTIHISNNTFENGHARSDAYAIRHQGNASTTVDAVNNWWGTTNIATIAALMSGNVNFTPFLTAPPPCAPVPATLVVDDDLACPNAAYTTIQAAVNAASPGDIIKVCAGTYVENITINKPLTILGPNAGLAGDDGGRGAEAIVYTAIDDPVSNDDTTIVNLQSSDVTIDGLTIDGDNPNPLFTQGSAIGGADVNASEGLQNGASAFGPFAQIDHLTIQNNIFKNFRWQGVYLEVDFNSNHSWNTIQRNLFQNLREGIQTYAMHVDVSSNKMVDVNRGLSMHGVNVPADAGFTPKISHNNISLAWSVQTGSRDLGIWVNYRRGTAPALEVSDNTVTVPAAPPSGKSWIGFYGLTLTEDRVVNFSNNTVTGNGFCKMGYYFSNAPSSHVTISDGSISGVTEAGVLVVNKDATWGSGDARVTVDHVTITAGATAGGVKVHSDTSAPNTAQATVTNNTTITGGAAGVLVEGSTASANVTNNLASIHGNVIGIDVTGGSATISANHIYDNGTGVRFTTTGAGSVTGNNFDDATDNGTDLRIDSSAGAVTIGAANSFAGDTYYIDNRSTQNFVLTGANAQTYDQANNFRIEDRMYHALDDSAVGRITWVAANRYVSTPATGASDETIQRAINAADSADTVNVEVGTFTENLNLNKQLTLKGAQAGVDGRGRVVGVANPAVESVITAASGVLLSMNTGVAGSTIDGLAFKGGTRGIESSSGPLDNLQIKNSDFRGSTSSEVFLNDNGLNVTIDRNSFDGTAQAGGDLFHLDTDTFNGFHFTNNWLRNRTGGTGLFVDGNHNVGPSVLRTPLINGNLVDSNQTGMNLGKRAFGSFSTANAGTISDNTFSNSGFDGLQGGIQHVLVTHNMFIANGRHGLALTSFSDLAADKGAQNSQVTCNLFLNNGFLNTGAGVLFSSTQAAGTISTNVLNHNNIKGNRVGVSYAGTEAIDATNNWWGAANGPAPLGSGDQIDDPAPPNIVFLPYLATSDTCAPVGPATLEIVFDGTCYKPGNTVTATLRMKDLGTAAAGFQAFLAYDTSKLTFVTWAYTPAPFGLPVINTLSGCGIPDSCVNPSPGILNLAAGINQIAGQSPSSASADLVTLTFSAVGPDACAAASTLTFRPHIPPTRLTDIGATELLPLATLDAPTITIDGTPPVLTPGSIADCYSAQGAAEAAALAATGASDACTAVGDLVKSVSTAGTCNAVVTVTVTDCAGNSSHVDYNTRIDNTAPSIHCPPDQDVYADAGHCDALVNVGTATATDDCDLSPTIAGVRSDALALNAPYPVGTTTITWTATDHPCGHTSQCIQTIHVKNLSQLLLTLQLDGNDYPNNLKRCIELKLYDCATWNLANPQVLNEVLTFAAVPDPMHVGHTLAQATATLEVPAICNPYICITARDPLHTLRRTLASPAFQIVGPNYVADFVAANKPLLGGNLNGDPYIDILDFGVFVWQFNMHYDGLGHTSNVTFGPDSGNTDCSTPYPHADISGDGLVYTADYTFVQINFLQFNENNCCGGDYNRNGTDTGPVSLISVADLKARGQTSLAVADLNGDGVLDQKDITAWLQGARPGKPLPAPAPPSRKR